MSGEEENAGPSDPYILRKSVPESLGSVNASGIDAFGRGSNFVGQG